MNIHAAEILRRVWALARSEGHTENAGPIRDTRALTPREVEQLCVTLEEENKE